MKNKDIFKKLVGLEGGNKKWHVAISPSQESEKWLNNLLPADADAPNIEADRNPKIFTIIFALSVLFFIILCGRLYNLQIIKGSENLKLAEGNRVRESVVRAPRGIIVDSNNTPLVKNVPNYDIVITPSDLSLVSAERNIVIEKTAAILGISKDEIDSKITEKGEHSTLPVIIASNIDQDKSLIIESEISNLTGVTIEINPIREYLDNGLLSHVFGYVGRISENELAENPDYLLTDYIGKSGLESFYEKELRGTTGIKEIEVDALGKSEKVLGTTNPSPGDNLKLSIDIELEKVLADNLKKYLNEAKVTRGSAVAINPQNGEILAIVSYPTYDNNLLAKGISDEDYQKLLADEDNPLIFRAIAGEYPSGSTIKPFIASAALEEGNITESTTVNSTGGINIGEFSFPDWKAGGHGVTNVLKAIAESVNTFFYAIGGGYQNVTGLGPEKIKSYLEKFGFGNYAGIDINGESKGSIPDPEWKKRVLGEDWYLGDTYHMAIGQGDILVTPLQMANAVATIANGGKLYKPHLVNSILDGNGEVIETIQPVVEKENVVSAGTIDVIKRGMRQTVTSGSAKLLNSLSVAVAGKTGTAQYGTNNSKSHAWFITFAPYDNPTIAMAILLEGAGGGDVYAVPVANEVYKYYFSK